MHWLADEGESSRQKLHSNEMQRMGCKFANLNKVKFADRFHSYFILIHPSVAIHPSVQFTTMKCKSILEYADDNHYYCFLSQSPTCTASDIWICKQFTRGRHRSSSVFIISSYYSWFLTNCMCNWICNWTLLYLPHHLTSCIRALFLCWHIMIAICHATNVVVCPSREKYSANQE